MRTHPSSYILGTFSSHAELKPMRANDTDLMEETRPPPQTIPILDTSIVFGSQAC
jgi:hypothetical protein